MVVFGEYIEAFKQIFFMGLISDLFSFLTEISDDSYLYSCERWFDNLWKKMYRPYTAEGVLEIRDGKFYKKLYVTFRDDTRIVITDDNDEGKKLHYVNLNLEQKKQLLRDGFLTIKEYE